MHPQINSEDRKLKRIFFYISISFFLLSLTQKSYCTTTSCADSVMVCLLGWAGIFSGGAAITWIANPLLFMCWFTLNKNLKTSMFLSVGAFLMSFFFLLFDSIRDNESAVAHPIVSYQPGYWLWMGSTLVMLIGTFALMLRHNTRVFKMRKDYEDEQRRFKQWGK